MGLDFPYWNRADSNLKMDKTSKEGPPKEYLDLVETWKNQEYEPLDTDLHHTESNPEIQLILKHAPIVSFVLDLREQQFNYISSNTNEIFGYDSKDFTDKGLLFTNEIIHPEDLINTWKLLKKVWGFIIAVPSAERGHYKFSFDYRTVKPDGVVVRILEQIALLQQDSKGNITHILGICNDITSWKRSGNQIASITSSIDHSIHFFTCDDYEKGLSQTVLSKRELEIVKLLAQGNSSKYIAAKLCISFHTVNTHRQHMIEKTKTKNTGELVYFAKSHFLI